MKKILLVSTNTCRDPFPVFPFGMAFIAGICASEGWSVTQCDLLIRGLEGLEKQLDSETFDAVGFSIRNADTLNSQTPDENLQLMPVKAAELVRQKSKARLILGGSAFSLMPEVYMKLTGADSGITGEGENAMRELLKEIESGRFSPVKIRKGTGTSPVEPLEDPEILDWYYMNTHIFQVQTKRGCPFGCVYCTYPLIEGSCFRYRKIEEFLPRIERLHKQYPDALCFFVDSIFNDPAGHWKTVLEACKARIPDFRFTCFTTPFRLQDADIDFLIQHGMVSTDLGIDATSDSTLDAMGKHFRFQDALHAAERMSENGVGVSASVMIGGPGETYGTIREGINNLNQLNFAFTAVFDGVRILPGTPLERLAREKGLIPSGWNGFDPLYYYEPGLDPEKVHAMLAEAFHDSSCIVYPPDRYNRVLRTIHKIGYLNYREMNS